MVSLGEIQLQPKVKGIEALCGEWKGGVERN